jgi:sec-independent protein translocase protein TatC
MTTGPRKDDEEDEIEKSSAPLLDHLTELRSRLIISAATVAVGFIGCFLVSEQLYEFLVTPFFNVLSAQGVEPTMYFAPLEFFFTQIKLAALAAIALAFPVVAYQFYQFVAPGLYKRERKAALPFILAMPFLFALGAAMVYYVMLPFIMTFAVGFEQEGGDSGVTRELLTRVGDYLSLATTLIMAFGIAFQLPVILTLLARAGIVNAAMLKKNAKFAIVGIFIVAAFLTPPDPISQLVLAGSIIALYWVSILSVSFAEKKARQRMEEAE